MENYTKILKLERIIEELIKRIEHLEAIHKFLLGVDKKNKEYNYDKL